MHDKEVCNRGKTSNMKDKTVKHKYSDLDEYINSLGGEYCQEELDEMKGICHEVMRNGDVDWHDYVGYKIVDVHPDPEGAKMGRPI